MFSDSLATHRLAWNAIANPNRPVAPPTHPHHRRRRNANIFAWVSALFPHGGGGQAASGKRSRPPFARCSAASALSATPSCTLQPLAHAASHHPWRCCDTRRQARKRSGPLVLAKPARPDTSTAKPTVRLAMRHPAGRGARQKPRKARWRHPRPRRTAQSARAIQRVTSKSPQNTAPEPTMIISSGATVRNPTPDPRFGAHQAVPKTILETKRRASNMGPVRNANCEETPRRRGKVRVRHRGCKMELHASPAEQRRADGTRMPTRPRSQALLPRRRATDGCMFMGALGNAAGAAPQTGAPPRCCNPCCVRPATGALHPNARARPLPNTPRKPPGRCARAARARALAQANAHARLRARQKHEQREATPGKRNRNNAARRNAIRPASCKLA
jgi:hypothetical protein